MRTKQTISDVQAEFMKSIELSMARYYSKKLSENVRRGIAKKKELLQKITK